MHSKSKFIYRCHSCVKIAIFLVKTRFSTLLCVRSTVHNLKEKLNGANKVCGWVSGSPVNNKNTMYVQHTTSYIEGISLGQPT